jgi:nitrogenase molybdenum-iron protein NifN
MAGSQSRCAFDPPGLPFGPFGNDLFVENLEKITGRNLSEYHNEERERLLDSLVDAHKYTAGGR